MRAVEEIVALGGDAEPARARAAPRAGRQARGARPPRGTALGPVRDPGQGRASASREGRLDGRVRLGPGPQPHPGEPRPGGPGPAERADPYDQKCWSASYKYVRFRRSAAERRLDERPVERRRATSPAASAACGSSDVSVMPGATLTSRNQRASRRRRRSGRCGTARRSPNTRVRRRRARRPTRVSVGGQPRGREVLRAPGVVAGVEVVRPPSVTISTAGSANGPSPVSTTLTATSVPADRPLARARCRCRRSSPPSPAGGRRRWRRA